MTIMQRSIQQIRIPVEATDGAGVKLKRFFPVPGFQAVDPFLLFDHFGSNDPDDYVAGFPLHPHRGIETITYMLKGKMRHKDSTGRSGVIKAGDVQWMSAGCGIMHEEMPELEAGELSGFQLWVNLSATEKMNPPDYQEYRADQIPEFEIDGNKFRLVCGDLFGHTGPVSKISRKPMLVEIEINSTLTIPLSDNLSVLLYVFEGQLQVVKQSSHEVLKAPQMAVLSHGTQLDLTTDDSARILLAAGEALNEPMVRWGPFVMNTREEIEQTLQELKSGTFPPV
ncbi:MAG: pirin family protein [Gammaproteobacteria bacterium]|nr:pirin family protein [Gammaproteobacteria bacterium]NNM13148.1 pirin family protein [Gammaproteobacteria bacterium]